MSEHHTVASKGPAPDPRCARSTRAAGLEPVASVAGVTGLLLVEWPPPWPRDAGEIAALAPVVQRIAALSPTGIAYRLQLVMPAAGPIDAGLRRVIRFARSAGPYNRFQRTEQLVAVDQVVDAAVLLLEVPPPSPAPGAGGLPGGEPVDVLVCGHGTRDVCCGSMGTALARELDGAGPRLWRTSHLGGHRFAPTAAFLPNGLVWGHLDVDVVGNVLAEDLREEAIRRHFRGTLGIAAGAPQVVEREALCALGWQWTRYRREVEAIRAIQPGVWQVRMVFEDPDGHNGLIVAEVGHDGEVKIPACRGRGEPATYPRWRVDALRVESHLPSVGLSG